MFSSVSEFILEELKIWPSELSSALNSYNPLPVKQQIPSPALSLITKV